ncbi:SAV_2336 N-terminal domain-related protein [Kitasatospora sp. SUK 42]|uniref:SAV_2336 N-terminal domain-related protein n=1 Tax=Kitasatospora sp. SUK 42 TaxID=1588882 RepID=UPI001C319EE2|nr:protein kinase [Kitasatospora sp. SUK 42]
MGDFEPHADEARSVLRAALAALVAPVDGEPRPQDLADALWISRLAGLAPVPAADPAPPASAPHPTGPAGPAGPGESAEAPGRPGDEPSPPADARPEPDAEPDGPDDRPDPEDDPGPDPKVELHSRRSLSAGGGPGAEVVQVTRPAALPGALAIARALRPLRRPLRHRAGGLRQLRLDEEATAAATAEAGVLLPVWQRARPRYSVDLLVDTGATMAVWHDLAGELATLLERHGAFAEVRTWSLDTDRTVPHLTVFRRRRRSAAPPPAASGRGWSRPLADPHGRRILFVLTDGVGPAWHGEELAAFLARTAATGPTAALQVLPRRLWHRTALRPAPVEGRAATHNRPAPVFRTEAALPGIPRGAAGAAARAEVRWLPVMEIDADWLAPWADLAAGRSSGWTPMLATPLTGVPRAQRPRRTAAGPIAPAERVAAFRAGSSPNAYRLACHLAAAPLSLPVMRLVQRATVPDSGQRELAELFLSGLLEVRDASADPDETVYEFVDGVREELLAELTRSESVRVLEQVLAKVSGRVAATFGGTLDFRALAAGAGSSGHRLPERSRPFAEVAAAVLAGAGGQHASIARTLGWATGRPVIRRELLTPAPRIVTPPDPPHMIGRRGELAWLTRECERGLAGEGLPQPRAAVVVSAPGLGRRRLVQEYVQRHGERHSFVHWLDGWSSESLQAGLDRLRAALSPDGRSADVPLSTLVADHPGWLIVVDDLRTGIRTRSGSDSSDLFGLAAAGRGCLIVTADSFDSLPVPGSARYVTLRRFTEAELRGEIRARLGEDYARIENSEELQQLLDEMPKRPDELAAWDLDERLAELTAPGGGGAEQAGSIQSVASFRLSSPALAMAAVPSAEGPNELAVYGVDGRVRFLNALYGLELAPPLRLDAGPAVVAMAALGHHSPRSVICTVDADRHLAFWDGTDGSLIRHHGRLPWQPVAMATHTHSDGRVYVLITDADRHVQLWDADAGVPVAYLRRFDGHQLLTVTSVPQADGPSVLLGFDRQGLVRRWAPGELFDSGPSIAEHLDHLRTKAIVGITGDEHRLVVATVGDREEQVQLWRLSGSRRSEVQRRLIAWHFRRIVPLGQGAAGTIWRGRDERDGSAVVIKSFDRAGLRTGAWQPEPFMDRVRRLQALEHPGIAAFLAGAVDDEQLHLVLEFVDGPNLRSVLARRRFSVHNAAMLGQAVAEALDYLHGQGVVHGEVKSSNILVRPDGGPALCDFGFDEASQHTDDLHALGRLLYEMLADTRPPNERTLPPPSAFRPGVPAALDELVLELLREEPGLRPSAAEVARRISASGAPGRPALPPDSDGTPPEPARRRLRFSLLGPLRAWWDEGSPGLGSLRAWWEDESSGLGPLRAWWDEEPVNLGSPKQQAVLAALLLHAPAPVSNDSLVNAVWGDQPPPQAVAAVRTYVARLRKALGDRSHPRGTAELLRSVGDGYAMRVAPGALDASVFDSWIASAAAAEAAGDLRAAHDALRSALELWQGRALEGVPGPYASWERTRLAEKRMTALEDRYAAALGLDRHEEVVEELRLLVTEHPVRERLYALLMLALYRCGRRADALDVYRRLQALRLREFDEEPSPALASLHGRILADDGVLRAPGSVKALLSGP